MWKDAAGTGNKNYQIEILIFLVLYRNVAEICATNLSHWVRLAPDKEKMTIACCAVLFCLFLGINSKMETEITQLTEERNALEVKRWSLG